MKIQALLNVAGIKRYDIVEVPDAFGKVLVRSKWAQEIKEAPTEKAGRQGAAPSVSDVPGESALETLAPEVLPDAS